MFAKAGLVLVALTFATSALERVAGMMGLVAGIVVSFTIIGAGGRQLWRIFRRLEAVVENTAALPAFMEEQRAFRAEQRATNERVEERLTEENARVHERLDKGAERMSRIEVAIDAWADAERAAVSAAIKATTAPRPPRSTDSQT